MTRAHWSVLVVSLWTSAACAQTPDRRAASGAATAIDISRSLLAELGADPLATRADSLVRAGRPWRATLLLAPALRSPTSATAAVRVAGARAAAAWSGWTEVERILTDAPWLDNQLDGEGRELLARSLLERGQPAVDDARRAVAAARTDAQRVVRRVLLARAFDRANTPDSAAVWYASAAARLPDVTDWLRLRVAGVVAESSGRAALFARVTEPAARQRIAWTDAQARERAGDFAGAARVYHSLSAEPAAFRSEALAARDDASKSALVGRIIAYLATGPQSADARVALEVLDKTASTLARPQELVAARAAADAGVSARAVAGFQRAGTAGALEPRDQLAYADALARASRAADAIRVYDQIIAADSVLGASASYRRARTLLQSGNGSGARAALRATATRYASVSSAAAPALLLLADLQVDDGDLGGAASSLAELAHRYPQAEQAPLASFRAALIAWTTNPARAGAAFDSLAALYPRDDEAIAARYWAARAYERSGKRSEAEQRWSAIFAEAPLTYYGVLSARRLGRAYWSPPAGPDSAAHDASVDSVVARVRTLQLLGMDVEAHFETEALALRAEQVGAVLPAVAQALTALGEPARALKLAARAVERGGAVPRSLYRAAYPVLHADALLESARSAGLDPALVAGLIRQESTWNPNAVSPVGARGLMQIMPSVGASLASSRGYPIWNPALLFEPDVSLQLGTSHLASSLKGDGEAPARALAAYNAGASRVTRWAQRPGASDPELFAEWIPFVETRDYVRVVQRNAAVYRALYGWR
ncbi:MAG: Lytic transglycosylase catalytic [Gemmatimonadetes bacterium]|nr:Lytic transglycosylase catalytic [Gemmatimonadota bacterium]